MGETDEVVDAILHKMNEDRRLKRLEVKTRIEQVTRVVPHAGCDGVSRAAFTTLDLRNKKVIFKEL